MGGINGSGLLNRTKIIRFTRQSGLCHACGPWAAKKAGLNQNFTPVYPLGSDTVAGYALSASRMDDDLMNRTTCAGSSGGRNRAPTAYEQQSAWGFHQCCVVRSKDETRDALPVPRNGKRRNGAGSLLGRRPKKELAYPKANVRLGPFTSSRRGPRPPARPAEQFAA